MLKNNYYFYPDFSKNSGLGHFFRCLKYSQLINNCNKFFLYKNNYDKKLKDILFKNKIKTLKINKKNFFRFKKNNNILIIDTYKKEKNNFLNYKYFRKILVISDKKPIIQNSDVIIDHTYNRNSFFYKKEINKGIKCHIGIIFFPFKKIIKRKEKKNIILINFGGVEDDSLIKKSLKIVVKLGYNKKILVISNNFSIKKIPKYCDNLNIKIVKFIENLDYIYGKTFLSFGASGISLYEKVSFEIPSITTFVARNQINNYRNFSKSNLIIKLNDSKKLNCNQLIKKIIMIKKNLNTFVKKIDNSKVSTILKKL